MDNTISQYRHLIEIRTPLVDDSLSVYESAASVIESLRDEDKLYDVHIYVDAIDMVPTVVSMSMSKRHNVEYYAHVTKFPGCEYVLGYLKSGYFKEVELIENDR